MFLENTSLRTAYSHVPQQHAPVTRKRTPKYYVEEAMADGGNGPVRFNKFTVVYSYYIVIVI